MRKVASVVLFVVFVLSLVPAFAQTSLPAGTVYMVNGKVVDQSGRPAAYELGGKILVWSDQKYYQPGEEIRLRAMGLAEDATQLQAYVIENLYNEQGVLINSFASLCECGDSNGGYIPTLAPFNFITLYHKRVPQGIAGRYDFTVQFYKLSGSGGPPVLYQATRVSVTALLTTAVDPNPIVIDNLVSTYTPAEGPKIRLSGRFPKGVLMYFFTGSIPYSGVFSTSPYVVSADGNTLTVPSMMGLRYEGRVTLMLPDASFGTTSPQTFVPFPMPSSGR